MAPRTGNLRRRIEVVDLTDRRLASRRILEHFLERLDADPDFEGVMVIAEYSRGGYRAAFSGTDNVAERLGRLDLLHREIEDGAEEDGG